MSSAHEHEHEHDSLRRVGEIALALPEATRVDIEAWDGEPTFRVRGKNFVFANPQGSQLTVKLPKDEAAAVVAAEPDAKPAGYGLGRHGWVSLTVSPEATDDRWDQIAEWIRISYTSSLPGAWPASSTQPTDGRPSTRRRHPLGCSSSITRV